MKTKGKLMLILLIIVGQLVYFIWTPETFSMLLARTLVIVIITKFLGDALGKFIFKLANYNWVYIRDYIQNGVFTTAGLYFAFAVVWYVPIGTALYYDRNVGLLMHIYGGGLLPTLFYYALNIREMTKEEVNEKRLRRKL